MHKSEASASLLAPPALPTEILSKIFLHCADIDGSLSAVNTIHVPLLLTKICRSWRTIAIGTRSLWSRLYLSIHPNATDQTDLVSTWLTRSGAYPLQIYIMWNSPPFFPSHAVLDILVQHSNHWRSMYFFLPMPAYRSLAPIRGNLPILTELSLGTHDPPLTDPILDIFASAPKLRSFECVNLDPYLFSVPWASLTHIPIMTVSVDDALDILRRAPRLKSGSFICTDSDDLGPHHIPRPHSVRHKNLHELAVLAPAWLPALEPRALLQYLTAPALQSLRICNIGWPFGTHLVTFVARVDALQSLYLRKTALSEHDVLTVLELLPTLKHLALLSSSMYTMAADLVLDRLTLRSIAKKPLVPRLETLEITLPDALSMEFVELLESRWYVKEDEDGEEDDEASVCVARLRKVEVGANDDYDEAVICRLEALAQAGMTVIIGSTDVPLQDGLEYMSAR